ncbi:MAG: Na(+)-translocating NADH-quinone reductase subunit C [Gammaproteobacteria bacterium]|nr:MAG: Na(+)-translocating NADH-quinone reductase subunit C [Gammaproteobacteria bacterium]RLA23401.1 MAG: Na(+)-translocating NADH-quinone reductase subunit C [Gammaproteobacteria bacterium]
MSEVNENGQEAKGGGLLAMSNDSFAKTIIVAVGLCLFCSILVSAAAVGLRPLQLKNKELDMKKNILQVAELYDEGTSIEVVFDQKIETKIIELSSGEYVDIENPESFDQRKASKDPAESVAIPADLDKAGIRRKATKAPVYLVKENDELKLIILPVHGYGLWSTMYGFLALESDATTVAGINFYDQGETPGLGGEVVNPKWRNLWKGKKVYNTEGEAILALVKGSVTDATANAEYKVDGLAGATLTSVGVTNLIQYWLGREGFAPYLEKIKKERS